MFVCSTTSLPLAEGRTSSAAPLPCWDLLASLVLLSKAAWAFPARVWVMRRSPQGEHGSFRGSKRHGCAAGCGCMLWAPGFGLAGQGRETSRQRVLGTTRHEEEADRVSGRGRTQVKKRDCHVVKWQLLGARQHAASSGWETRLPLPAACTHFAADPCSQPALWGWGLQPRSCVENGSPMPETFPRQTRFPIWHEGKVNLEFLQAETSRGGRQHWRSGSQFKSLNEVRFRLS